MQVHLTHSSFASTFLMTFCKLNSAIALLNLAPSSGNLSVFLVVLFATSHGLVPYLAGYSIFAQAILP